MADGFCSQCLTPYGTTRAARVAVRGSLSVNRAGLQMRFDSEAASGLSERSLVAEEVARLIIEEGYSNWREAKRRALSRLGLTEQPNQSEVEAALHEFVSLFDPEQHAERLRLLRAEALHVMRFFADFSPEVVGGVAGGWVGESSIIHIEVCTEDLKTLDYRLIDCGWRYRLLPQGKRSDALPHYELDLDPVPVRLRVVDPRRRHHQKDVIARCGLEQLTALTM